jgi:hypothetical protein
MSASSEAFFEKAGSASSNNVGHARNFKRGQNSKAIWPHYEPGENRVYVLVNNSIKGLIRVFLQLLGSRAMRELPQDRRLAVLGFDFSLIKDTPIGKRGGSDALTMQFRAEFFNLFNIVNFALPENLLRGTGFGFITRTAGTSRQLRDDDHRGNAAACEKIV